MSIEPSLEEQEALAETFRRAPLRMTARERAGEAIVGLVFLAAVAGLWLIRTPTTFSIVPAVVSIALMVLASRVPFDTPFGFTVPTQLAFVPMLFAIPLAIVPIAVALSLMLAKVPDLLARRTAPSRVVTAIGNSLFSVGPVAVFVFTHTTPQNAGPLILVGALAAQFGVDFTVSAFRVSIDRGVGFSTQLNDIWVYGIDAALSGVALAVAKNVHSTPLTALSIAPLMGVLASFAHERHNRLRSLVELNNAYRGTALVLGDVIESDDGYTGEHSRAIVTLCLGVAESLGLEAERRRNLEFASLLHDVGKIAIPKEIINKPGELDPQEWTIIKTHTIEGQRMLDRVGGFMREVGLIVRSHHERWDGTGYPDRLAGDEIPIEARIIAGCDAWNAMRTDRAYRTALPYDVAVSELLSGAGSQFDPSVVEALAAIVSETPREGREVQRAEEASEPPHPTPAMPAAALEDVRSTAPLERLLEESWSSRSQRASHRELVVETVAAIAFLAIAVPLAIPALGRLPATLTALLVGLYAVTSRGVKFPFGAGSVVPSYLILVPMLLLLPVDTVPLLAAAGLVLGSAARLVVRRRGAADQLLFAIPDAWHALGPALVLSAAGSVHGLALAAVYVAALLAGFLADLVISVLRESLTLSVAPRLQGRVIAGVWLVDLCIAPLGFLVAQAAREHSGWLLLLAPLVGLFAVVGRDRSARIAEAERRLGLVAQERTRLQAAVQRLGEAFAAKLDLQALTDVLLAGSVDALDAEAGWLNLQAPGASVLEKLGASRLEPLLQAAAGSAQSGGQPRQIETEGVWVFALPITFGPSGSGAVAVARHARAFRQDEQSLLWGLVERAQQAAREILEHEALRQQAVTDPLTRLGNRRRLSDDLGEQLSRVSDEAPLLLLLFDLNGFKSYNDTFGHVAGDALLARLGHKLNAAVSPQGSAYRLGGDEFCALLPARRAQLQDAVAATVAALEEHGETFSISASCGTVLIPHEAVTVDYALQLADERMYAHKQGRPSGAREQAHDVLLHIVRAKQPELAEHSSGVAKFAVLVGRSMGMESEELDELARAATLHDVGKVGLPDPILTKPGPLDSEEWDFVRQHTLLGERILSAAPALRPVAAIVRSSHERWDGGGYPDGLRGEAIPLAARIVAVCEAYDAMISERCYRAALTPAGARAELRDEAGRQFDPDVVAAFLELVDAGAERDRGPDAVMAAERASLAAAVVSHVDDLLEASSVE